MTGEEMAVIGSSRQLLAVQVSYWQFIVIQIKQYYKCQTMSTNILIKRVCEQCGTPFMARTTRTRYCSKPCNTRAYKNVERQKKVEVSNLETKGKLLQDIPEIIENVPKEIVNIKELSVITSLSERTLFRIIKDTDFPKLKVRNRLLFNKAEVMNYLTNKYGSL